MKQDFQSKTSSVAFSNQRLQSDWSVAIALGRTVLSLTLLAGMTAGCAAPEGLRNLADRLNIPISQMLGKKEAPPNDKPAKIGEVVRHVYDGSSDDLLTAGLGKTGLGGATIPAFANNEKPTTSELRRRAIFLNYRALLDVAPSGGYGRFYGPNVSAEGQITESEGKIAGVEIMAFADDGTGQRNVAHLIQIPSNFNQAKPCIVAAPSSGSRGVYGAIGTVGEWGLKKGCAVAYTDKGTGLGMQDLDSNKAMSIEGEIIDASTAGKKPQFVADLLPSRQASFSKDHPHRIAMKHAHSQKNPEKDWGQDVLTSIRFAFWALNDEFVKANERGVKPIKFQSDNTIVIAASVSNGGGASLRAAEQDSEGLIDGVAVSEPQIQPRLSKNLSIEQGNQKISNFGKTLYDYTSLANLYQPCAAYAASVNGAPGQNFILVARAQNRCAGLQSAGLLSSQDLPGQALEALGILKSYGWMPESDDLHASHYAFATPGVTATYAMSYSRASAVDNLCGLSFAAVESPSGKPVSLPTSIMASFYANSNGIAPTGGVQIINQNAEGGPGVDAASTSMTSKKQDFNLDAALCLRGLIAPSIPGQTSSAIRNRQASDLKRGLDEVLATGHLRGKPAIVVHGRSDALVPVNHSSRPYFALNRSVEGEKSGLRYLEVTNAQHFDGLISNPALPGMDTRFVPLHRYYLQALDALYNHLSKGTELPESQVVRTKPRGGDAGKAPDLSEENVPPFSMTANEGNRIVFSNGSLMIAQ
jgi:hydroxybutyrate-dimer hydrolase